MLRDKDGRTLRPLLPATRGARKAEAAPPKAKRVRVSNACSACRTRKTKCSAERPKCSKCISNNTVCEYVETNKHLLQQRYDDLRNQQNSHAELLNKLVTLPEDESLDLLRRLREGHDAGSLPIPTASSHPNRDVSSEVDVHEAHDNSLKQRVERLEHTSKSITGFYDVLQHSPEHGAHKLSRHIRRGISPDNVPALTGQSLKLSPSPNQTNRNILPPTSTSIEFELVALHPNAYPALIPLDVASIDLGLLGISPFTSFLRRKSDPSSRKSEKELVLGHNQQQILASSATNRSSPPAGAVSSLASEYIDDRLSRIDIRRWTNVAIQDDLAARAINLYLVNEAPWWGNFDMDLFLDDLVSGETRFCSRLLVSSVLAWACQFYTYYDSTAYLLARQFLHEAAEIYSKIKDVDCLTTLAATSLMCMAWITFKNDRISMKLLAENASMAVRLHLYNVPIDASRSPLDLQDNDIRTAARATAWGSFNLQMAMSMSYRRAPFAKTPPSLPIPGDSSAKNSVNRTLPPYQGQGYAFVCKLWLIAFEMNYQYYHKGVVSLAAAELIFQKLLGWADDLHEDTKRVESPPDRVTNLHIWFHNIVLDLFRPFTDLKPQPRLTTFAESSSTPKKVVDASIKQLKRLIYTYRATSLSANYSIIWQSGLLYLLNHILHHYTDKEAHFYFLLCMRGYQNLARTVPFIAGVVQSVAAMAIQSKTILPADASKLIEEIASESEQIDKYVNTYPIDLYPSPARDPDTATLEHLVHKFRNMRDVRSGEEEGPGGRERDSIALFTTLLEEEGEDCAGVEKLAPQ